VRVAMLIDFLHRHLIDILFLQEVTQPVLDNHRGYTAYTIIGTTSEERPSWQENTCPSLELYAYLQGDEKQQISRECV